MKNISIIIILIVLIAGGLFFFGVGKKAEVPVAEIPQIKENTGALKEFFISGKNFSFDPAFITVKKGDRVKINFKNTNGFHDFVIDEYGISTKQANSPITEVLEFTADKIGSFEYYCSVGTHRSMGMKGILVVE